MSWQKLTQTVPGGPPASGLRFMPIVDGYVLPAPVREIFAQGKENDVVTLTGANQDELGAFGPPQGPITPESWRKQAQQHYGAQADEFLRLYPAATDQEAVVAQRQSTRDRALVSMYLWAKERSKTARTRVYEYLWDHALPGPDAERFGAFHTSEVPYVLNTLYMSDRPFTAADHRIAGMMSSYWANFAANGDPNGPGLPRWQPIGAKPEILEVGDKTAPIPVAGSPAKFEFFEKYLLAE